MEALNETIETAIKNITDVVREELVDLVYTRKIDMLMKELNKCKSEMVQYKLSHTNSSTSNCDDIVVSNENITLEIEDISICEDNLNVIDFDDEEEFKCEKCSTVQGKNNCGLCDVEDVCEECHGQGGAPQAQTTRAREREAPGGGAQERILPSGAKQGAASAGHALHG